MACQGKDGAYGGLLLVSFESVSGGRISSLQPMCLRDG